MAALQKALARCANPRTVLEAGLRKQRFAAFSSSSSNPIFELKTCKVPQSKRQSFLQQSEQHLPRKTNLAKMHGFWVSDSWEDDVGEGFVASLWEYENFTHREDVRRTLRSSKEWGEYVKLAAESVTEPESVLMYSFPWVPLTLGARKTGGVYELRRYRAKPGTIPHWAHRFQQGVEERFSISAPLGIWFSEFGPLNAIYHIWPYESLDKRMELRGQAVNNEVWKETVRDTMAFVEQMESKVLVGAAFSPIQ